MRGAPLWPQCCFWNNHVRGWRGGWQLFLGQWPPHSRRGGCCRGAVRPGVGDLPKVTRSRQNRLNTSIYACSALTATPCKNQPVLQENRILDRCVVLTATAALDRGGHFVGWLLEWLKSWAITSKCMIESLRKVQDLYDSPVLTTKFTLKWNKMQMR